MYYPTFEPYLHSEENNEINSCLICWENNDDIINYDSLTIYNRICKCNGHFHLKCINQWTTNTMSCPICRSKLIHRKPYFETISISLNNYFCEKNSIVLIFRIIKLIYTLCLIWLTINISISCSKYINNNNNK